MAISDPREFWLEFTLDHSEIEARKNFVERFGVEPQYVRRELILPGAKQKVLRVGPVPSRTQLMTGTYPKPGTPVQPPLLQLDE
jgi:hypothetical protein